MNATIKICGLKDLRAIDAAISNGAQYLGFVCDYPKSPRSCSALELIAITNKIHTKDIFKVAVMVDPNDRIIDIKSRFNLRIIKAIKIKEEEDLQQIDLYPAADDLLLDTPAMEKSELFNFNLLDNLNISSYFLAGGINITNIHQALHFTSKIDISSGVESEPGVKDINKIKDFMDEVKRHA